MPGSTSLILSSLTDPEIDALVEVTLLAACADGSYDSAEAAALKGNLHSVDEFWLTHVDLDERLANAKRRIDAESREARLAKLRTVLPWPEQRFLALRLAVRIVVANGQADETERKLILDVAEALGVSPELLAELTGQLG